jgi:hypothetical protein
MRNQADYTLEDVAAILNGHIMNYPFSEFVNFDNPTIRSQKISSGYNSARICLADCLYQCAEFTVRDTPKAADMSCWWFLFGFSTTADTLINPVKAAARLRNFLQETLGHDFDPNMIMDCFLGLYNYKETYKGLLKSDPTGFAVLTQIPTAVPADLLPFNKGQLLFKERYTNLWNEMQPNRN